MAYSKTVWNNNTPPDISAENLNKMEQGIADAQFPDGGSTGQILSKTNDGTGWIDAPNSAEWGNIDGQLSEQTDLYSELESKITMPSGGTTGQVLTKTASGQAWDDVDGLPSGGTAGQVLTKNSSTDGDASWQNASGGGGNVDTVNGISPDANKNVQTDVVLTQAEYDALPSSKLTDNVNYFISDGAYHPQGSSIDADGVIYDNTDSGLTATTVQGAIDELNTGFIPVFSTPTSGYPLVNHYSYRVEKSVHLNFRVQFPIQSTNIWMVVAFTQSDNKPNTETDFPVMVVIGNHIITTLGRVMINGNIEIFMSTELIGYLSSVNAIAYYSFDYRLV